jgi:hypothetical protein
VQPQAVPYLFCSQVKAFADINANGYPKRNFLHYMKQPDSHNGTDFAKIGHEKDTCAYILSLE